MTTLFNLATEQTQLLSLAHTANDRFVSSNAYLLLFRYNGILLQASS